MTQILPLYGGCPDQRRGHSRRWSSFVLCAALVLTGLGVSAGPGKAQTAGSQAAVQTTGSYDEALRLAESGRLDEAQAFLQAWQPVNVAEQEQRLWGLATIARKTGHRERALELLEQLVARRPDVARFRIALAETLAESGQKARARHHLDSAFGGVLSASDQDRARALMTTLSSERLVTGHFALSFIPSSNAAQKSNARTITIMGQPFVVADDARAQPAQGVGVQAGVTVAPRLGPRSRLRFSLSAESEIYDGRAQDDLRLRADLGIRFDVSDSLSMEVGTSYQRRWIDRTAYSQSPGLYINLVAFPTPRNRVQLLASVDDMRHDVATGLNGLRSLGVASYTVAVTPQLQLRTSFGVEHMDAAASSAAYRAIWAGVGASYFFKGGLQVRADASLRETQYMGPSFLFGTTRRDRQVRVGIEATHGKLGLGGFAPVIGVDYTRRKSNLTLYSYDELGAKLGVTRSF